MRLRFGIIAASVVLWGMPAFAQSNSQVEALVEALRQASPQTGIKNDGLYSDWQVIPGNIPRWSKACIGRELTPAKFEASPVTARAIVTCVVRDLLRDEFKASGNNESLAVRRAASWWMTGDPAVYNRDRTSAYTQKVLNFYQQAKPTQTATPQQQEPSAYDRAMQIGYNATRKGDYNTGLINFKRALSQRPGDPYATQAIANVEVYLKRNQASAAPKTPAPEPQSQPSVASTSTESISQEQAVNLVTQWLQAKSQILAPPFDQQLVAKLTTGELYQDLTQANGVIAWLKNNQAYYRFGVQKLEAVNKFAASGNKATLEVNVTEERTLYQNGKIEPNQTDFQTRLMRYTLESQSGQWKITDYKTVDGSLLERGVAN